MSDSVRNLLREQALGSAVQYHIRDVIHAAARTVQSLRPQDELPSGMRENQLRNVVNVAIAAQHVEEIAAFILYQMGRSTNRRQWLYGDFGKKVVHDLLHGDVYKAAQHARDMALRRIGEVDPTLASDPDAQRALLDAAHIALARQYLGYLNRLFYFADDRTNRGSDGRWGELDALIQEETV